jgi:hypothetical protein
MWSCAPEDWAPFSDPIVNIDELCLEIESRYLQDPSLHSPLSEQERNPAILRHFLKNNKNDKDATYAQFCEWIAWRRGTF